MASALSHSPDEIVFQPDLAILGLGYVGRTLAGVFLKAGLSVSGIDRDPGVVDRLQTDLDSSQSPGFEPFQAAWKEGRFKISAADAAVPEAKAFILCVQTPLDSHHQPDLTFVKEAGCQVGRALKPGSLVVLESTSYPGTTDEVLVSVLEAESCLRAGEDFHVAFSPERTDPGRAIDEAAIPKIVGGCTREAGARAADLYRKAFQTVVEVSDARTAEATKILENVYRCVNIALVNELKILFQKMGINIWEAIKAASTKPFGFQPFYPGPGLGGHCIPIDPFYLSWKAREFGMTTRFIELAGEINIRMPEYVVQRLTEGLSERGKPLKEAAVLVLGMAYKPGIGDTRESPGLKIMELLLSRNARPVYHDPFVSSIECGGKSIHSRDLTDEVLALSDAAVIVTDHPGIDYARIVRAVPLVVDTRNATVNIRGENIVQA